MQTLAESHTILASKMESDVERPLKDYQNKNREMQNMSTIQGNLISVAKEVDNAHKKASKLSGGKSSANKVANATSDVEAANQLWESQAPFVFEQLQSLDETRINHLRDVLTQLETHEVDLVERNRITAESCLNALLNVDTSDEISTFVARISGGDTGTAADPPRLGSRGGTGGSMPMAASTPTPPVPRLPSSSTTPSRNRDNSAEIPSPYSTASRATTGEVISYPLRKLPHTNAILQNGFLRCLQHSWLYTEKKDRTSSNMASQKLQDIIRFLSAKIIDLYGA